MQKPVISKYSILYIEDNHTNIELVEHILARRDDVELLVAVNGILGLSMIDTHSPDVILIDINLPDMNGIDIMRKLRGDPVTSHIPVMALTSNAYNNQINEAFAAGFSRYITKPFVFDEFNAALDDLLNQVNDEALIRNFIDDKIELVDIIGVVCTPISLSD